MPGPLAAAAGETLNCQVTAFPIAYLGLPLSKRRVLLSALMPLVDKIDHNKILWIYLLRGINICKMK